MAIHFLPVHHAAADPNGKKAAHALDPAYGIAVLCWLLSAGVYIAAKWVEAEMPPWTLCFWRVFIAALVLAPLVHRHYGAMAETLRSRWPEVLLIGGIGLSITQGLMYTGLNYTTAINAGLILALMPTLTMILARITLGEPMGVWQGVGSAIAFCGMVVIIIHGDLAALITLDVNAGELWIVAAAVCFAVYTVLLKRTKFELERLPLLVVLLGGGAVAALPFYVWEILHDERTALTATGLLALGYTAIPGGALMYYLFNWSVQALGAGKAGVLLYLQPVFIALLAYVLLGERLHLYHLTGATLILIGVLVVTMLKPASASVPEPRSNRPEHEMR
jgi:drug/metabolite transporter (DMT)-like permease